MKDPVRRLLLIVPLLVACGRKPPDATPEGAVRELLERLEAVHGDPKAARAVFELLSKSAQRSLSDRARRASAATGKRLAPEQMIAPSHYFPRFRPQEWSTRTVGARATVDVVGLDPATERAGIPCVFEDGGWRIDLVLSTLPPIERRQVEPQK